MAGDLVVPKYGSMNDVSFAYGLMLRRYIHSNLAIRGNLLKSRLSSNDNRYTRNESRGIRTETPLTEFSIDFELDILGHRRNRPDGKHIGRVSPYVFAGMGIAFTNPKTTFGISNNDIILDQNADVSNTRFVVPVGAGLRLQITENLSVDVEIAPRATFSDYLDGVSISGNPDKNDWYGFGSVQLWYKLSPSDKDRDGIADAVDGCPEIAGLETTMGCPDRDKDGIKDSRDQCPDIPGAPAHEGCPDTDKDGIADVKDACPSQAGLIEKNGCPDTDGDGIVDSMDQCPDLAGVANYKGCPIPDTDGDGLLDDQDTCPGIPGPASNNGCPYKDTDQDGIPDYEDKCPTIVGVGQNNGCPEIKEEAHNVMTFATQNVSFETNQDKFMETSYDILNEVAKVMMDYPDYRLKIDGYTDNRGADQYNQLLSESRARRCFEYLLRKGIPAHRMQYAGYGKSNPVASNVTIEGRFQNRRVEFSLYK